MMSERCSGRYQAPHLTKSRNKVLLCGLPEKHDGPCGPWVTKAKDYPLDYPTAWRIVLQTNPLNHHERCSYRNGRMLCDCAVVEAIRATLADVNDAAIQRQTPVASSVYPTAIHYDGEGK